MDYLALMVMITILYGSSQEQLHIQARIHFPDAGKYQIVMKAPAVSGRVGVDLQSFDEPPGAYAPWYASVIVQTADGEAVRCGGKEDYASAGLSSEVPEFKPRIRALSAGEEYRSAEFPVSRLFVFMDRCARNHPVDTWSRYRVRFRVLLESGWIDVESVWREFQPEFLALPYYGVEGEEEEMHPTEFECRPASMQPYQWERSLGAGGKGICNRSYRGLTRRLFPATPTSPRASFG